MTNDERDWRDALSDIHEEIRDVRDDVAAVRSEVSELRKNQEFEKNERIQQKEDHKLLLYEHKEVASEVSRVHNDVDLLKENIRLTALMNERIHDNMGNKIDKLTDKFEKHADQEERDRQELIRTLQDENFQIKRHGTKDLLWAIGISVTIIFGLFGMLWGTGTLGG